MFDSFLVDVCVSVFHAFYDCFTDPWAKAWLPQSQKHNSEGPSQNPLDLKPQKYYTKCEPYTCFLDLLLYGLCTSTSYFQFLHGYLQE